MKNGIIGEVNLFTREYRRQVNEESIVQMEDKALSNMMNAIGQINQTFMIIFRDVCLSLGTMLSVKDELKQYHLDKTSIKEIQDNEMRERIQRQDKYAESLERQLSTAHLMLAEQSEATKIKFQMSQKSISHIDIERKRQEQQSQQFDFNQQNSFQKLSTQLSTSQSNKNDHQLNKKRGQSANIIISQPLQKLNDQNDVKSQQQNKSQFQQIAYPMNDLLSRKGSQNQFEFRSLYFSEADEEVFKQQKILAEKKKLEQENELASNQKYNSMLNYNSLISQSILIGNTTLNETQDKQQQQQPHSFQQQKQKNVFLPSQKQTKVNEIVQSCENNESLESQTEKQQNNKMEIEKDIIAGNSYKLLNEEEPDQSQKQIQNGTTSNKSRLNSISSNEVLPNQNAESTHFQNSGNKRFKKQNLKKSETFLSDSITSIQASIQKEDQESSFRFLSLNRDEQQKSNGFIGEKKSLNFQKSRTFNEKFEANAYESKSNSQNDHYEDEDKKKKIIQPKKTFFNKINLDKLVVQQEDNVFAQFEYKKQIPNNPIQEKKKINTRTKEVRESMRSFQCGLCKKMHDVLGENFCGNCSRHRSEFTPPHTPNAHYQNLSETQSQDEQD